MYTGNYPSRPSPEGTEVCTRLIRFFRPVWQKFKNTLNSVPTTCFQSSTDCRARRQLVTVTAAALRAASQRRLRGPVCRHRGSQHAARSADCGEELRGASAKRWRSAGEANAKRWRNQLVRAGSALASARSACTALRALCTPFLYMVLVGFERRLPIGDLQLTRSGFFAAKSWPPL